jgi:hypothetical protein
MGNVRHDNIASNSIYEVLGVLEKNNILVEVIDAPFVYINQHLSPSITKQLLDAGVKSIMGAGKGRIGLFC